MVTWKCDLCGKETLINPPTELLFEMDEKGKSKLNMTGSQIPVMSKMKRQNPQTGLMMDIPIQAVKDLTPRAYITQIRIGNDKISKDFCKDCLDKEILPLLKPAWDKLEGIKGR